MMLRCHPTPTCCHRSCHPYLVVILVIRVIRQIILSIIVVLIIVVIAAVVIVVVVSITSVNIPMVAISFGYDGSSHLW